MRGRHPLNIDMIFLLLLLAVMVFPVGSGITAAGEDRSIAILVSDSDAAYQEQAVSFSREAGLPTRLFNLQGDVLYDPGLKDRLIDTRPVLIYALGAKAAFTAKLWTRDRQDIPVLFAMVLNWQRYKLLDGQNNMTGIAAEVSPGTQFVNMTMFSPTVKRIGLLYSPHSEALLAQARKEAVLLGLELVAKPIDQSKDFQRGFKEITGQIDAFWVLNDPVLYTLENMQWLGERCLKGKILCVGQSQNLARTGMTLTVNPDLDQISGQAAAMARNIVLRGQKASELKVMEPLGTQLILNLKTAGHIGLAIPPQASAMASTVIER